MITDLPDLTLKKKALASAGMYMDPTVLKGQLATEQKAQYYSLIIRAETDEPAYTAVVKNDRADTLRVSLINMTIYECYLFALGLPANFPKDRILVLGCARNTYIPDEHTAVPDLYSYELVVPARTEREEYRQRMVNELNDHFHLEVRAEMLQIVKGSRTARHADHKQVEIIWDEQLMMIMKSKKGAKVDKSYPLDVVNN